jgi:hypothetical protein
MIRDHLTRGWFQGTLASVMLTHISMKSLAIIITVLPTLIVAACVILSAFQRRPEMPRK